MNNYKFIVVGPFIKGSPINSFEIGKLYSPNDPIEGCDIPMYIDDYCDYYITAFPEKWEKVIDVNRLESLKKPKPKWIHN